MGRPQPRLIALLALTGVVLVAACAGLAPRNKLDLLPSAAAQQPASQAQPPGQKPVQQAAQQPSQQPAQQATQQRADARNLAAQLQVSGARGRLSQPERAALLARLGAQGGASVLNRQLAAMAQADSPQLFANNSVQLLIDGPSAFAAMFAAIEAARHSVLLQSYIVEDSGIAQRLAALLAKKRAQGLQVAMLYDDLGSYGTSQAYFDGLRAAGVPTCALHPINPLKRLGWWSVTNRDHRKILSVDRDTGFTGGINISEVYASGSFGRRARTPVRRESSNAADKEGWRDTQVQIKGPAVAALDDLVRAAWVSQGCEGSLAPPPGLRSALATAAVAAPSAALSAAPAAAPVRAPLALAAAPPAAPAAVAGVAATTLAVPARAAGAAVVRIIPAAPDDEVNRIYTLLLTAIDASQRSVYLTMAYFAPGEDMVAALSDAAQRGVDVQLVLPARSDFAPVLHAGRSYYDRLLEAGVKVHELKDAVLHAKTAVIDGVVSTVGSSNMDWRSFVGNSEVNAVVFGEDFGDAMVRMFRQDVQHSQPISLAEWRERPMLQRTKETLARWLEPLW